MRQRKTDDKRHGTYRTLTAYEQQVALPWQPKFIKMRQLRRRQLQVFDGFATQQFQPD